MSRKELHNYSCIKGRSMVEMIGVLVIVGALTIGGLVGHKAVQENMSATKVLKEAMNQAAELKLRPKHVVNSNGELVYHRKSDFIVSRTYDEGTNSLILKTNPLSANVCQKVLSAKEEDFFTDIICSSDTNVLTFKLHLNKAFVVAGKDDIGYNGDVDYGNLIPDDGNSPPISDEVISCPVQYDCDEAACCTLTGRNDFCGNPTPIYYNLAIYQENNDNGCLVDKEICLFKGVSKPENEKQECPNTCTPDGRCISCGSGNGNGENISDRDCLSCNDDEQILEAPNGQGFYCCPSNANSLAWDSSSYHCCLGNEVSMIVQSKNDSICCPEGTIEAAEKDNNYVCVTECSDSSKAIENCSTYTEDCSCNTCNDGYVIENNTCTECSQTASAVENCSTYGSNCTCTACKDGYAIKNGVCEISLGPCAEPLLTAGIPLCSGSVTENCFSYSGNDINLSVSEITSDLNIPTCNLEWREHNYGGVHSLDANLTVNNLNVRGELNISSSKTLTASNITTSDLLTNGTVKAQTIESVYLTIGYQANSNASVTASKVYLSGDSSFTTLDISGTLNADTLVFMADPTEGVLMSGRGGKIYTNRYCSNELKTLTTADGKTLECTNIDDCSCPASCESIATTLSTTDCSVSGDGVTITCSKGSYSQYTINDMNASDCNLEFSNASVYFQGSNRFNNISVTNKQTSSFAAIGVTGSLEASHITAINTQGGTPLSLSGELMTSTMEASGSTITISGDSVFGIGIYGDGSLSFDGDLINEGGMVGIMEFRGGRAINRSGTMLIAYYCGEILYNPDAPLEYEPECSYNCKNCGCKTPPSNNLQCVVSSCNNDIEYCTSYGEDCSCTACSDGYTVNPTTGMCEEAPSCVNNTACGTNGYCADGTCVECTGEQVPKLTFDGCEALTRCDARTKTTCTGTAQCGETYTCTPNKCSMDGSSGPFGNGMIAGGVCSTGYCELGTNHGSRRCPTFDENGNWIGHQTETAPYWSDTCLEWNLNTGPTGNRVTPKEFRDAYSGGSC